MKQHVKTTTYKDESRLFFVALSCLMLSVCTYMYFVSASISHVVMRKEIDREMNEKATMVSDLESRYIEMQHSVSSDIATLRGFAIADKKVFIDTSADTLVSFKR